MYFIVLSSKVDSLAHFFARFSLADSLSILIISFMKIKELYKFRHEYYWTIQWHFNLTKMKPGHQGAERIINISSLQFFNYILQTSIVRIVHIQTTITSSDTVMESKSLIISRIVPWSVFSELMNIEYQSIKYLILRIW